jgi:hypothetical protein
MSNALAIAGVTAVLKDLLNDGLIDNDITATVEGNVKVTALPPDRVRSSGAGELADTDQLNLFLYQVTPNAGWRNAGLPSRDNSGNRLTNAPLGLDLHYLLTAYGANEFNAEILLGYAMQILHENPVLPREKIRATLTGSSLPGSILPADPRSWRTLSAHELADQVEQIKITPASLSTEEISRLWSAMQTRYRTTAAYHVSVVLIEARNPTRAALPVRERRIHVRQFRQPIIESITPQVVSPGETLTIRGANLSSEHVQVAISDATPFPVMPVSDRQIDIPLSDTLLASLSAGVNAVRIIHRIDVDPDPARVDLRAGSESNTGVFILRPSPNFVRGAVTWHTVMVDGVPVTLYSAPVTATVTTTIGPSQRTTLLLNELDAPASRNPFAYSFDASPSRERETRIDIPVNNVRPGTYLSRLRIDGAESALRLVSGEYREPVVTFP